MNDTTVTVVGNVATEPRYHVSRSGVPLCSFRVGTTPRRKDWETNAWVDGPTSYYGVTCWRFAADNVAGSLKIGEPVLVTGRQRVRNWERDGKSGTAVEIDAVAVGHDMFRGQSRFTRVVRQAAGTPDQQDAAAAHDRALADEFDRRRSDDGGALDGAAAVSRDANRSHPEGPTDDADADASGADSDLADPDDDNAEETGGSTVGGFDSSNVPASWGARDPVA